MPEELLVRHCSLILVGMKTRNTEAMASAVKEGAALL